MFDTTSSYQATFIVASITMIIGGFVAVFPSLNYKGCQDLQTFEVTIKSDDKLANEDQVFKSDVDNSSLDKGISCENSNARMSSSTDIANERKKNTTKQIPNFIKRSTVVKRKLTTILTSDDVHE